MNKALSMRLILVFTLTTLVLTGGCSSGGNDVSGLDGYVYVSTGNARSLSVRGLDEDILDDTYIPLAGAAVDINGIIASTNTKGYFKITDIEPGTYTVNISADGFQTLTIDGVTINSGKITHLSYQEMTLAAKDWNFLVYMDADNDLEQFAISDFNEMEQFGSTSQVNVLVLFDRIAGYDSTNGDWTGTRLYYVTKDSNLSMITSTLLADLGERDMSHPDTLRDFIIYCQKHFPASKTCLTLWNHGGGVWPRSIDFAIDSTKDVKTAKTKGSSTPLVKGICWDDTTSYQGWNCLTTDEVATALAAARIQTGQMIEVINMDTCLTQMLEVAYEWRDEAEYLVGSEENVPGPGNDYSAILSHLTDNPSMSPAMLATMLVDDFYNHYNNTGANTTYSAISLGLEFDSLMSRFATFATALYQTTDLDGVYDSWNNTTWFADDAYEQNDLYDFAGELITRCADAAVVNAAGLLRTAITDAVLHHKETGIFTATSARPAYGIGILIASSDEWQYYSGSNQYAMLRISTDTDWDDFIVRFASNY